MSITGPWVGSSAKAETGQAWMTEAAKVVRLHAAPFWMSELIGGTKEVYITLNWNDYNYNPDDLINRINQVTGGNYANAAIVINVSGQYVAANTGIPCFRFPASMASVAYIRINNSGYIFGRGGTGRAYKHYGTNWSSGKGKFDTDIAGGPGGPAIENNIGGKLQIYNTGVISGGGAGGPGIWREVHWTSGGADNGLQMYRDELLVGAGGAPFGARGGDDGSYQYVAANLTSPGHFIQNTGLGGELGQDVHGAPGGWSVSNQSPNWLNRGDVRGKSM
ncbi:hypothetical protein NLN92_14355 [Citrobacter portucalensis]|uniref:hypothetical protein n=1 Tax=Citrobacter portucalensis TaxID=1639133 RepID=UPI00226BBD25|nr:hypothetical protein [Citrobacter portucalensis]MCX8979191.1 hypothetical protein [Citrobacter portucalensis]